MRASSLNIARYCRGAATLLSQFKTNTDNLRLGSLAHGWIQIAIEHEDIEAADLWLHTILPEYLDILKPELHQFYKWCFIDSQLIDFFSENHLCEHELGIDFPSGRLTGHIDLLIITQDTLTVVDWKYGKGQQYILPKLIDDYQLLAYAILAAHNIGVFNVRLLRILVSDLTYDELYLNDSTLSSARKEIELIVASNDPDNFTPGPHCDHCLVRNNCKARASLINKVNGYLVPDTAINISLTNDQATRYALARKMLKDRLAQLDDALIAYLEQDGNIEHEGQKLIINQIKKDKITNNNSLVLELYNMLGHDAFMDTISTTKSATIASLKKTGKKAKEAKEIWDQFKKLGYIEETKTKRLKWIMSD